MPDLRYHLISLISVFLALAIGILLGVAMADRGVISDRLRAEITQIQRSFREQEKEISRQNQEINALRERTSEDEEVMRGMAQAMISDRLQGVDVALVSGPWADDAAVQNVKDALSAAGANFTSIQSLSPPEPAELTGSNAQAPEFLYRDLAQEVLGASDSSPGFGIANPGGSPEVVVFVGGGKPPENLPPGTLDALRTAERAMFETWTNAGVRMVAAESSATRLRDSEIELFRDAGVPSVDYAETAAGQAAVVQLAAGAADGTYGTKPTASDPFPPSTG